MKTGERIWMKKLLMKWICQWS